MGPSPTNEDETKNRLVSNRFSTFFKFLVVLIIAVIHDAIKSCVHQPQIMDRTLCLLVDLVVVVSVRLGRHQSPHQNPT
jgi:membrane protein YdbS with pleckstrin-like domain